MASSTIVNFSCYFRHKIYELCCLNSNLFKSSLLKVCHPLDYSSYHKPLHFQLILHKFILLLQIYNIYKNQSKHMD